MYRDILKLIKKTDQAVMLDKMTFEKYVSEGLSLEETIRGFMYNNGIKNRDLIDSRLFKDWIESLGYRRDV